MKSRTLQLLNLFSLLVGVVFLAVFIAKFSLAEIGSRIGQVGWYFGLAFVIYAAGLMITALAWGLIFDPANTRVPFGKLLAALWAGHAINQLTPTASLGEVLKGTILSGLVDSDELIASLITFNFLGTLTSQIFTLLGPAICLLTLALPTQVMVTMFFVALAFFVPVALMYGLLRYGVVKWVSRLAVKIPFVKIKNPEALVDRARAIDERIRGFRKQRGRDFWLSLALLFSVRVLQAIELFVILIPLLPAESLSFLFLLAILTQTSTQMIIWAATFIPGQIGVAEGGNMLVYKWLGLDPVVGFSVILVRRIRTLIGISIGLAIGLRLGASPFGGNKKENKSNSQK